MTCEEFWNQMPELADVPPAAPLEHVRECQACTRSLNRQVALAAGLKAMAAEACRVAAPAKLEATLLSAFRAQSGVLPPRMPRRNWLPWVSWASAGVALLAMGLFVAPLFVASRHRPAPPHHSASSSVELAAAQPPAVEDSSAADNGFIPLPNAEQIEPNEDINIVRVEVPRSAMEAVGISVSPERAGERVQADVMMGSDGLARAVRFVDATF